MSNNEALAVLDRHVDLLRWLRTDSARIAIGDYLMSQMEKRTPFSKVYADSSLDSVSAEYCRMLSSELDESETYWVTAEMTQLIEASWASLDRRALGMHELPADRGFVEFAKPISVPQDRDHADEPDLWPRFDAISWSHINHVRAYEADGAANEHPGVLITYWESIPHAAEDTVKWEVNHGYDVRDVMRNLRAATGPTPYLPVHVTAWAFDLRWDDRASDTRPDWGIDLAGVMQRQALRTLWLMLKQELPAVTRLRPPRAQARRLGRSLATVPEVNVIDLRRRRRVAEQHEPGEGIEWSHRWIVNSHVRNQWYPSEGVHRQIFILAYEKGPEDKPLVVKDRVYRLVR